MAKDNLSQWEKEAIETRFYDFDDETLEDVATILSKEFKLDYQDVLDFLKWLEE